MKQFVLKGKGCSGRGVRIRTLSPTQRSTIIETAARSLGADGTVVELRAAEAVASVNSMVVAITEQTGLKDSAELISKAAELKWLPMTAELLDENFSKYFGAKDQSALIAIFRSYHEVTEKEVDDILGEVQDVAED